MQELKQSTAFTVTVGPILDADGVEYTSAVIGDLSIRKHDGSVAAMAAAATLTHSANGVYTLVGTTGNSDTIGRLQIHCNKVGYAMDNYEAMVLHANVYDVKYGSVAPSTLAGTAQTGDAYAVVNSGTHGNAALKTLIDAVDNFVDTEVNALTTELAKVPKSDSNVTWNATALASIQSESNDALVAFFTSSAALVDAICDEALSGHTTSGTLAWYLAAAKDNTDYPDGYVIWNSTSGSAGTTVGVNGTVRNPSSVFANAGSIAGNIGTGRIRMTRGYGSGETISSGLALNYTLDLNGGTLKVADAATLSGFTFQSTSGKGRMLRDDDGPVQVISSYVENCRLNGAVIGVGDTTSYFRDCEFYGNITISGWDGSSPHFFSQCYNSLSNTAIQFDFGSTTAVDVVLQGWYGDLEIVSLAAGQVIEVYGYGKLTIAASCTGGTIKHTSHVEINDLASAAVTTELISEPTPWNAAWDAEVQSECADALNAYDPPTNAEMEARTLAAASYATASALDAVDNFVDTEIGAIQTTLAALFTTALTESYRADGAAGTVAQYLCELSAHLGEVAITSTTKRLNRHDGTTQAMAFTLNDASTPTAITRST